MSLRAPAVVLRERGSVPSLLDVDVTDPGAGEVLVRMTHSGVCHTDLAAMTDARTVPVVLGHEGAGVVEAVGDAVDGLQPGDHVVVNWQVRCGRCRRCTTGRSDLCEAIRGTSAPRVFLEGAPLDLLLNAGTFCPWVVLPADGAVRVSREVPLDRAAMLGCGVVTGVGAALYTARVAPGDTVVVLGSGGVGLNVVQGARLANAGVVIAVDLDAECLRLASLVGAHIVVDASTTDVVQAVLGHTAGRGAEHVFEVVGSPSLMRQGIDMLARGGVLTLVGAARRDAELTFAPRAFLSRQLQIRACIYGNALAHRDLPLLAELYLRGALLLDPLRGRSLSLKEVPVMFHEGMSTGGKRPIVTFEAAA